MEHISALASRRTGRPLSFDREAALTIAMHLFWEHGFEATSIAALTQAMGITPPSLYAAFGDKRRLFMESVDRYLGGVDAVTKGVDDAATARDAAYELLTAAAIGQTSPGTPSGCLLASSIVSSSVGAADVREELAAIRRRIEAALRSRIERDVQAGIMPDSTDAETLAGHVFAVVQGMSTLAKDGADRTKLLRIVDGAMRAWPVSE
jgi:AcrR family transcriptional regulator